MRGSAWVVVSVLILLAAGCSPRPKTAEATPGATAPPALVVETKPDTESLPASATPTAAEPAQPPAPTATPAPPPAPPSEAPVRFSRADFSAHERRLAALIANAETRDTSGETQYRAEHGEAERQHCATRACIERSYAAEEAWLRHWEGSGDVR